MEQIRWGILGCGGIARTFVKEMAAAPHGIVTAAGSRSLEKARAFCGEFSVPNAYGSYEELCASDAVDAIYVATPHGRHCADTLLALAGGKAVLCEKAFCINAREAEEMISSARERKLFLCEAMWPRFVPALQRAKEWIREGRIGEVRHVTADYGFAMDLSKAAPRLYLPECGGGALLDLGVYPLDFISMAYGDAYPDRISAFSRPLSNGMDAQTSVLLEYAGGTAALSCSLLSSYDSKGRIYGSAGKIEPEGWFLAPERVSLHGETPETYTRSHVFGGHEYMLERVSELILDGKTEAPEMPLSRSLDMMRICDEIRGRIGLNYPNDA